MTNYILEDIYLSKVNYDGNANWNGSTRGNVTTVGTNGGPSHYCTYDQSGNVWELIDTGDPFTKLVRGGSWSCGDLYTISSSYRREISIHETNLDYGIRLCSSVEHSISNWSYIENIDNPPDELLLDNSYGNVSYTFFIQKYPVTNAEYCSFLNSIDTNGDNLHNLYSPFMGVEIQGGIILDKSKQYGQKYTIKTDMHNKPVVNIDWLKAVKLANWIHNGADSASDIYNGSYTISENSIQKNDNATCWVPNENEWYKAAYYDPTKNNNSGGYWKYATKNDITPEAVYIIDQFGNGPCQIPC